MPPARIDGRRFNELRPVTLQRGCSRNAAGSAQIDMGGTRVLCTVSVEDKVPPFLQRSGQGWVTAEYSMLPGSTPQRTPRDRGGRVDGRVVEIQRLIGRSMRAVVDRSKLGERTLWIDCDVLQADGGTRTASITAAYVALVDALAGLVKAGKLAAIPVDSSIAAVSVGIVKGEPLLDLCYLEDSDCDVDMNVVMTGAGNLVEVQGSAERATFTRARMDEMLGLAEQGLTSLRRMQEQTLAELLQGTTLCPVALPPPNTV